MSKEMQIEKRAIEEMAKVIETTEQIARDAHCGYPSPRMYAKDLYWKGYRKASDVAREIFESIEECIYLYYNKNDYTMPNIEEDIAEIKKKYLEEKE